MNKPIKQSDKTQVAIPCTVFSRVVGYYSATQGWNKGKRQEFKERETYKIYYEGLENDTPDI